MYAPSLKANNIVFQKTDLALGSHSIKVEFTGIKNATATSNIILVDSFEIINGNILATGVVPIIEPTVSHFEEYNSNIAYVGSWGIDSHSAYSEGKSNYTTTSGSSLSFSFTGTAIKLLTASSTNKGIATVTLDGVSYNVDMYSSYLKPKNIVFQKTDLILGTHTIKVEFTGTKNTAATSSIILVDSFEIINGDINSP